jgi:hypothetical protein
MLCGRLGTRRILGTCENLTDVQTQETFSSTVCERIGSFFLKVVQGTEVSLSRSETRIELAVFCNDYFLGKTYLNNIHYIRVNRGLGV